MLRSRTEIFVSKHSVTAVSYARDMLKTESSYYSLGCCILCLSSWSVERMHTIRTALFRYSCSSLWWGIMDPQKVPIRKTKSKPYEPDILEIFPISSLSVEKTHKLDDPLYSEDRSWLLKWASWPDDMVPHRFLGCLLSNAVGRKSTRPDRVEILIDRIALCQWSIKWSLKWRNRRNTQTKKNTLSKDNLTVYFLEDY